MKKKNSKISIIYLGFIVTFLLLVIFDFKIARKTQIHQHNDYNYTLPDNIENVTVYEYEAPLGQTPEDLINCFQKNNNGKYPFNDDAPIWKNPYLPQDLGEWFLHKQVQISGRSTTNDKADYFIVNTMPILSKYIDWCNGMNHEQRQNLWVEKVKESELFKQRPQDHLFICQSWLCRNSVNSEMKVLAGQMTYLIHETAKRFIYNDYRWGPPKHHIVIPYLAHSGIEPYNLTSLNERKFNVTFTGSFIHGHWRSVFLRRWPLKKINLRAGGVKDDYYRYSNEMKNSKFCLIVQGHTPSSRRLFDAMLAGCIPVFVGYRYELPFENIIPYEKFVMRIGYYNWFDWTQYQIDNLHKMLDDESILQKQNEMLKYVKYIDWRRGDSVLEGILSNMLRKDLNSAGDWYY